MNKKGFTLVELLAVLVILATVTVLGFAGINAITAKLRQNMVKTKLDSLEESAIYYGQEHVNELTETCTVDGVDYNYCKLVTVKFLIDNKAFDTEETDKDGKPYLKNNVTKKSMMDDTIQIYKKNNRVYAKVKEVKSAN